MDLIRLPLSSQRLNRIALRLGMASLISVVGCRTVPTNPSAAVDALFAASESGAAPGAAIIVIDDGVVLKKSAYGMAEIERDRAAQQPSVVDSREVNSDITIRSDWSAWRSSTEGFSPIKASICSRSCGVTEQN